MIFIDRYRQGIQYIDKPAIQAVKKQAIFPAIMARTTSLAMVERRAGTMADSVPSRMPIDPMLEKPHRA